MKEKALVNLMGKLSQKKAEIELKERLLKKRERKLKTRRYIEVGSMASKFGIDSFDDETLLGAFADLQEKSKQPTVLAEWKQKGKALSVNRLSPLIISLENALSDEVKTTLKEKRFKWNTFRKEWYGYGIKEEIEDLLKGFNGKVDIAKG